MATKILSNHPFVGVPMQAATESQVHAKRSAFRWKNAQGDLLPNEKEQFGRILSMTDGDGASSLRTAGRHRAVGDAAITGVNHAEDGRFSLTEDASTSEQRPVYIEKKGILKNCRRCFSEAGDAALDDGLREEQLGSPSSDFWYSFRSVDEIFSERDDIRKRVSFSEKVLKNTYRPGTSILQQKQKAQKKREKRKTKDCRRTVSESDVADMASLTRSVNELSAAKSTDSDSGLETETSPALQDEDTPKQGFLWQTVAVAAKKKRNRNYRKPSAEV